MHSLKLNFLNGLDAPPVQQGRYAAEIADVIAPPVPAHSRKRIAVFIFCYMFVFASLAACGYYLSGGGPAMRRAMTMQNFVTDLTYYDMPRMVVAVGGDGERTHVRLDISLEIAKKDMMVVEGYQPQITEKLNKFLISLPPEELHRFAAFPELREEMLRQVNSVGSPVPVHDLLLRQMIIM